MKTIIKTTIKDQQNLEVKESVDEIFNKLIDKGSFILLTRIRLSKESKCIIKKSAIKMIIQK